MITGKVIRVKGRDLPDLADWISKASMVGLSERDDKDAYTRFKYACGRNFLFIQREAKALQERLDALCRPHERFAEYERKRNEAADLFCAKNENGEPALDHIGPGEDAYKYTLENKRALDDRLKALAEEYREAINEFDADRADLTPEKAAELDLEIPIGLHCFPFTDVPEKVTGGYLAGIRDMLVGVPDEVTFTDDEGRVPE